ncbi:MAG: 2-hydroxyacyl-CoA dehydratase family protein [Synergistaceae bacterium]|jgi:benzoyl-CoA reductase/2-hydroxyglutaryl-CoA dehydratase subunit BcrC/BadD/HgdB|nr:2-hydroxyacyl-CoA dehydratase family protein [Synergistaceae bacterium]
MTGDNVLSREERFLKKFSAGAEAETRKIVSALRTRLDYSREFDYFIELAETCGDAEAVSCRTGRRTVNLLCVQAPVEMVHAAGFQPFRVWSGSSAASRFSLAAAPALMCPMLKALLGSLRANEGARDGNWIIPTTCDWVIKFPEMASYECPSFLPRVFWLELPHLKDGPNGGEKWLDEIYRFKKYLESMGEKIDRHSIAESIELYREAWSALTKISRMRGCGLLANVWFALIAGTMFLDDVRKWTAAVLNVAASSTAAYRNNARVFLAGSPIVFPNFKLHLLLEETGMSVVADDLCSSERIIPGAAAFEDTSEFGLMSALAERYHRACLCPTFIDNDRRVNNILGQRAETNFSGVVFHVLKGCHPYDIEGMGLERTIKDRGLRFIRIETDYMPEDERNLSSRLEAYRCTLPTPQ